jgi:hypothetical protein
VAKAGNISKSTYLTKGKLGKNAYVAFAGSSGSISVAGELSRSDTFLQQNVHWEYRFFATPCKATHL